MLPQNPMPPAGKRPGINQQARRGVVPTAEPDADDVRGPSSPAKGASLAEQVLNRRMQSREAKRPVTIAQTRRAAKTQARGGSPGHPNHRAARVSQAGVDRAGAVTLPGSPRPGY